MKSFLAMAFAFMILTFSTQVYAEDISVDYGDSNVFTKREMDCCIDLIEKELNDWSCKLKSVRYVGDAVSNSAENIKYVNELAQGNKNNFDKKFTNCLLFKTDFQSPPDPHDGKPTAWRYDSEYKDYEWYFGFYEVDGEWKLLGWGY